MHSSANPQLPQAGSAKQPASVIALMLRLACGDVVTAEEALRALHAMCDRMEAPRLERIERIKARNAALRRAGAILGADSPGAWVAARRLADAIDRFESRVWPRLRAGVLLDLSPSEIEIHCAFLTGGRIPKTTRGLYELLK